MVTVYGIDESVEMDQTGPLPHLENGKKRKIILAEDDQTMAMSALRTLNLNEFDAVYLNPANVASEGPNHLYEIIGYDPSVQPLVIADLDFQLLRDQGVNFSGINLLEQINILTKLDGQRGQYNSNQRIYIPLACVVTSLDSAIDPEKLDADLAMLDPYVVKDEEYQGGFKLFGARKEMSGDGITPRDYDYNLVQTVRAIYRAESQGLSKPLNEEWMKY